MNIFATSPDPEESASDLDDARVVKMLTETCQLLSTAVHLTFTDMCGGCCPYNDGAWRSAFLPGDGEAETDFSWMYKPTHVHGGAVAWAKASRQNFQWLVDYAVALANEYQLRYPGGTHKALACAWRFMAGREYLGQLFKRHIDMSGREGLPGGDWAIRPSIPAGPSDFYDGAANGQLGLDFRGHADGPHAGYRAYLNARYALSTRRSAPRWSSPASKPAWVVS